MNYARTLATSVVRGSENDKFCSEYQYFHSLIYNSESMFFCYFGKYYGKIFHEIYDVVFSTGDCELMFSMCEK